MFAQQVAVVADGLFELMRGYRERKIDQRLPGLPPPSEWLGFYTDHRRITLALPYGLIGEDVTGKQLQDSLDAMRDLSTLARNEPLALREMLKRVGVRRLWKWVHMSWRSTHREYWRNLKRLSLEIRGKGGDGAEGFDRALRESPEFLFYVRVVLPCLCLYQTLPIRLLRQATREGPNQARAVERLLRLDPVAFHHEGIAKWCYGEAGGVRTEREAMAYRWMAEGLNTGKFERRAFKEILGGLIEAFAGSVGGYWCWKERKFLPGKINSKEVMDLFHAVAMDRGQRRRVLYDPDLQEIEPGSWARTTRKYRRLWGVVLGASKSAEAIAKANETASHSDAGSALPGTNTG